MHDAKRGAQSAQDTRPLLHERPPEPIGVVEQMADGRFEVHLAEDEPQLALYCRLFRINRK
jgi:hypothetical protein